MEEALVASFLMLSRIKKRGEKKGNEFVPNRVSIRQLSLSNRGTFDTTNMQQNASFMYLFFK